MRQMFGELIELLFPTKCAVCGELSGRDARHAVVCLECSERLVVCMEEKCRECGRPLTECTCMSEAMQNSGFLFHRKLFYYKSSAEGNPANRLILSMKDSSDMRLFELIAGELSAYAGEAVREEAEKRGLNPVLTYVPRSRYSVKKYGTDQALLLTKALSKATGIPYVCAAARHNLRDREMKSLSPAERAKTAEGLFLPLEDPLLNKDTLLITVDDIITTGSSVIALSKCTRTLGVRNFGAISVGRTY